MSWFRLVGSLAALLCAFGAGWYVESLRWSASLLREAKSAIAQQQKQQGTINTQATAYEADRAIGEQQHVVYQEQIRTIFKDRPVPGDCAAPVAVVRVLTEAVERANSRASGRSGGSVPAAAESPDAADRPRAFVLGRDDDLALRGLREPALSIDPGVAEEPLSLDLPVVQFAQP